MPPRKWWKKRRAAPPDSVPAEVLKPTTLRRARAQSQCSPSPPTQHPKLLRVDPIILQGNWTFGKALDYHTVHSTWLVDGGFENEYTPMGWALHRLKYCSDRSRLDRIEETVVRFLSGKPITSELDGIVSVPPSVPKKFEHVAAIAIRISRRTDIPFLRTYLKKTRDTPPQKIGGSDGCAALKGAFTVADDSMRGKKVLVLDDLIGTGTTLHEITRVLLEEGGVSEVYVLTLTKTRSHGLVGKP